MALRRDEIGKRIREARLAKGWKQKRLAAAVHVEPQTVSNWERAVSTPDLDTLELIGQALGVEVTYLLRDPAAQAKEQATVDDLFRVAAELLAEVRALQAGQDEIGQRLGRLEDTGRDGGRAATGP